MTDVPWVSRDLSNLDVSPLSFDLSRGTTTERFNAVLDQVNVASVSSQFEPIDGDITYRQKSSTNSDDSSSNQPVKQSGVYTKGELDSEWVDQVLAGSAISVSTIADIIPILKKTIVHFIKKDTIFTRTYFFELPNQGFHIDVSVEKGSMYQVSLLVDKELYALILAYQDELLAYLKKKGLSLSHLSVQLQPDEDSGSHSQSDNKSSRDDFTSDNDESDLLI